MFDKVKDPVCGMKVTRGTAQATSQHMSKTFYFCSSSCKKKFDQDPIKYMPMKKRWLVRLDKLSKKLKGG